MASSVLGRSERLTELEADALKYMCMCVQRE